MTARAAAPYLAAGPMTDAEQATTSLHASLLETAPNDGLNPGFLAIVSAVFTVIKAVHTAVQTAKVDGTLFGLLAGATVVARELREPLIKQFPQLAEFTGEQTGRVGDILHSAGEILTNEVADSMLTAAGDNADAVHMSSLHSLAGALAQVEPKQQEHARASLASAGNMVEIVEAKLAALPQAMFALLTDVISKNPESIHADFATRGGEAVNRGLVIALTAYALPIIASSLPGFAATGLTHAVDFSQKFVGLEKVAAPLIEPHLEFGLAIPAHHQAAKWYRTKRPSSSVVREQAYQRHVTPEDYAESLRLEGMPEDIIRVLVADLYVDPRPREIMLLCENADPDPVWLAAKFKEHGWDDDDVRRAVDASQARINAPGRQAFLSTLHSEFVDGHIPYARLEAEVNRAVGNPDLRSYYLGRATYARAGQMMEELASAVADQYKNDVLTSAAMKESLEALGFPADEVNRRLAVAGLQRNVRMLAAETSATETVIRQVRGQAFTNLRNQYRAGLVDRETAIAYGLAFGFDEVYVENVLAIDDLKKPPSAKSGEPAVGVGALADAAETIAAYVKQLAIEKQITATRALELLVEAGVPLSVAEREAALLDILTSPPDGSLAWPFQDLKESDLVFTKLAGAVAALLDAGFGGKGLVSSVLGKVGVSGDTAHQVAGLLDNLLGILGKRKPKTRDRAKVDKPDKPPAPKPPAEEPIIEQDTADARAALAIQIQALQARLGQLSDLLTAAGDPPVRWSYGPGPALEERPVAELHVLLFDVQDQVDRAEARLAELGVQPPPGTTEDQETVWRRLVEFSGQYAAVRQAIIGLGGNDPGDLPPLPDHEALPPIEELLTLAGQYQGQLDYATSYLNRLQTGQPEGEG